MKRSHAAPPSIIGMVLLSTVLLTLFLFTFAAIDLKASASENKRAERITRHADAYNEALNKAEEKLAGYNKNSTDEEISFSIPIDEKSELQVSAARNKDHYEITTMRTLSSEEWEGSDQIQVYNPEGGNQ